VLCYLNIKRKPDCTISQARIVFLRFVDPPNYFLFPWKSYLNANHIRQNHQATAISATGMHVSVGIMMLTELKVARLKV
jgi:hypothetical protein